MDEYVSRELLKNRFAKRLVWLKKDIHDEYSLGLYDGCEYDTKLIDEIPTADVAPVVHGRWIKDNNSLQTDDYYCCYFDYNCSECGKVVNNRYELPKYCPNCGAKMDGGVDDACL